MLRHLNRLVARVFGWLMGHHLLPPSLDSGDLAVWTDTRAINVGIQLRGDWYATADLTPDETRKLIQILTDKLNEFEGERP